MNNNQIKILNHLLDKYEEQILVNGDDKDYVPEIKSTVSVIFSEYAILETVLDSDIIELEMAGLVKLEKDAIILSNPAILNLYKVLERC